MNAQIRNGLYLLSLIPGLVCIAGLIEGAWFCAANLIFSLMVLGILEWLLPSNESNLHSAAEDVYPELVLWLHIPIQIACVLTLFTCILNHSVSGGYIVLAALSTGVQAGTSAVVVAHEYIHRKNKLKKALGIFLLFSAGNVYFYTAHLKIHHKWVGTENDPSTARLNESLYSFFIRSVWGQIKDSFWLEKKQNSWFNWVLLQIGFQFSLIGLLYAFIGIEAVIAWMIHSFTAAFLLEYVNYIEHYGLTRKTTERATEMHSWDSNKLVSRFVLVDLSRHADHHYYAAKPYHVLNAYNQGNKLPSGYAGLFFIAIIPPLWYKVINPRISKH